mmetsp:Transcript_92272/g.257075  ORF Transcript_92272/g.257075 Transcript_92272/m.257075 type:complete len:209 (-) Transcript_92272:1285-1911(-)
MRKRCRKFLGISDTTCGLAYSSLRCAPMGEVSLCLRSSLAAALLALAHCAVCFPCLFLLSGLRTDRLAQAIDIRAEDAALHPTLVQARAQGLHRLLRAAQPTAEREALLGKARQLSTKVLKPRRVKARHFRQAGGPSLLVLLMAVLSRSRQPRCSPDLASLCLNGYGLQHLEALVEGDEWWRFVAHRPCGRTGPIQLHKHARSTCANL